jgi:hypothetical protein
MKLFGYSKDKYSMEDLREDFRKFYTFGFYAARLHTMTHLVPNSTRINLNDVDFGNPEAIVAAQKQARKYKLDYVKGDEFLKQRCLDLVKEAEKLNIL